ncbi:MAG: imidazolonepropionase, partial [Bacteroidota bacterium]
MKILIKNIKELVSVETDSKKLKLKVSGSDMSKLNTIKNAYLLIEGEKISAFGKMVSFDNSVYENEPQCKIIDAGGKMVFPSFCDSHTH